MRNRNAARHQFVLQAMQRQMRRLADAFLDKVTVRLQNAAPMAAHLSGRQWPVSRYRCDYFTTKETATPNRAATTANLNRTNSAFPMII